MKGCWTSADKHKVKVKLVDSVLAGTLLDPTGMKNPAIMLARARSATANIEAFQNHISAPAPHRHPHLKYNMSLLGVVRAGRSAGPPPW